MNEIKLLFIIDNLGAGGAQNQLTLLAGELDKKGYPITIVTYYPQQFFNYRLVNTNINHVQLSKKGTMGIGIIYSLLKLIRQNKYSHIISFLDTPNFYNVLTNWLSGQKSKTIISYRSKTDINNLNRTNKRIKEWVNKQALFIISNSHHERLRWQKSYPALAYKWHTIYNAVDPKMIPVENVKKNEFLVVGSIGPDKNALVIIEALHLLNQSNQPISITWIGQSFPSQMKYADYHNEMLQKIDEYQLNDLWHWQEPTAHIAEEYSKYKALILASKTEGLPNVVCEALYCGLPCIVSNVLDHPKIVQDDKTGFLFDPDNAAELREVLSKMYSMDDNKYESMCKEAKKQASELFGIKDFVQQYEKLLS